MKLNKLHKIIQPNQSVSGRTMTLIVVVEMLFFLYMWMFHTDNAIPKPLDVLSSYEKLFNGGMVYEIFVSLKLCLFSITYTIIISLLLCYASVIPIFKPFAFIVSKFRFLTLVGLSFLFTVATEGSYSLKVSLLTFSMTVFFVTSLMKIIDNITENEYNHAKTLGLSDWEVVWEVVILARIDKVFDVIRENFAIAWMMLTMVEGLVRTGGGIGVKLLIESKYFHLKEIFAIQIVILIIGIFLDYIIGLLKEICCPHTNLTFKK